MAAQAEVARLNDAVAELLDKEAALTDQFEVSLMGRQGRLG